MIVHNFDPILIDLGILQIRWYSLAYVGGILAGWWYGRFIIKKQVQETSQRNYIDNFDDLIGYIIIGVILGGRLGYVFFYNPTFYLENFLEIFKLWKGGMSFHGGLIGVIVATYIFSRIKNLNYKIYFDTIACVAPIGIFLGRIANFINGELYGTPTSKFWGVIFPKIDNIPRHPSQIYEALLEGVLLFVLLNFTLNKKVFKVGAISLIFLILYGTFRILSEQFRQPDEHVGYIFGFLTIGSILSAIMIILGALFLSKLIYNEKNR
ncbi:MAG: prolipoprotein diacylglyceryl transferase [Candidatus Marinimicrobia bacterium]|nr:prolipoprotein diacylglyceryl transferase [Candidatus Neomarinimicrobiota bacterium]RPG05422.1 MAG: prolipoprotein diacylglyceryl transferase [Pelagibacteraceae bacterium TMED247]|tara:strand:- start:6832 stop:7629 length:798 start_codon:yes stop_codon:yes gene_type:complete